MTYKYDRQIEINEWIISTRWFYVVAVFLVGILGNSLVSLFRVDFSFYYIAALLLFFLLINSALYKILAEIKKNQAEDRLRILGAGQIIIEISVFSFVMYLVGDGAMAQVFFFLPIISASIIFGLRGALLAALASALIVNLFMVLEYFDMLASFLGNPDFLDSYTYNEIKFATFNLVKTLVTSNFYFILALVAGYSSRMMSKRERDLFEKIESMNLEMTHLEKERDEKFKDRHQLEQHDKIISTINMQLNQKIVELEKSEKSMIRTFADLRRARENTEKERRRTAAIIANFVDPILLIDKHNRLALVNPAARDILGLFSGGLDKSVVPDNNYSMENFRHVLGREYTVKNFEELKSNNPNEEEVVIKISGQELTYKIITAKVADEMNEDLGVMKIFYNLTREKMIDRMKSEFISIAAHQLRTPLSAIKWVMKMILDGDAGALNDEQYKFLNKGYQANERIINLVNDMLNVSRIEEGRFGYNFKPDDIVVLVEEQIDNLETLVNKKNIKIEKSIAEKVPLVFMDASKMRLVLQNLIENAVKYTPEYGKIEVRLQASKEFIKIMVKDNGVGIPEKDKDKLFSKFFRAENVVRMQTEGSGLGLFIVKNIIKKHGGEIRVESEEGRGTEFIFTLPLTKT